jgi:hypothetical protein
MVDVTRNLGLKSSTAIASWSRTTAFAHFRAVSCRWRAALDVGFRGESLRPLVPVRRGLAPWRPAAGHHPLAAAEFLRRPLPELRMRQVVGVARGGGDLLHAPVDTDHPSRRGQRLGFHSDDARDFPKFRTA